MQLSRRRLIAPAATLGASIAAMILLMLLTSPVKKIFYAIIFFAILFIALMSFGYLIVRAWGGKTNAKNRYRIIVISLFIIISLMFKSAQSFNWVDALIVILVAFGLLFYGGRRF